MTLLEATKVLITQMEMEEDALIDTPEGEYPRMWDFAEATKQALREAKDAVFIAEQAEARKP